MEKILEQILGELKGLNEGQGRLETKMDGFESRMDNIEKNQTNFELRMDSFERGQERLESNVDAVDGKLNALDEKVNTLDEKVDTVDKKVDQLKFSRVEGLEPYFQNVEKHIDTTNEKMFSTLQQHQDSIDILSARSIHHEADIKSINRLLRNQ